MNKAILGVLGVQTALLAYVAVTVTKDKALPAPTQTAPVESSRSVSPGSYTAPITAPSISADEVREIIRSELAIVSAEIIAAQSSGASTPAMPERQISQAEADRLRSKFESDLSALRAVGRASPGEMAALQATIAKLPPQDRQAALNQLSKAINDGYIDARF